jgi:hypothetical protein
VPSTVMTIVRGKVFSTKIGWRAEITTVDGYDTHIRRRARYLLSRRAAWDWIRSEIDNRID